MSLLRRTRAALLALVTVVCVASAVRADTIVPGPDQVGHDAELAAKADRIRRQIHGLLTVPLGWGLEAYVASPDDRAAIDAFIASGEEDFEIATGRHPYDVIDFYEEQGDLGMFGGVQAAGDAFRYQVLRDSGAPADEIDRARAVLLRAMDGLHWYTRVTGEPGVIARGLMRIVPEDGDPPLPGTIPETVPLFDGAGNPQPEDKRPTWRADNSGELPFLIWLDDTSKDQFDGYVLALGAVYDAVVGDPTIPTELVDRLVEDARAIGRRLMERVEVAPGAVIDLVLMDADGRPTSFHDLAAEELTPGAVVAPRVTLRNGFNAVLALGAVRTLFHITGDLALGQFYYDDLIGRRAYLDAIEMTAHFMYTDENTNHSNVNMAFVGAYGVLRYESDEGLARRMRELLETRLYAPGRLREPRGKGQSFFDFIYAGFRSEGALDAGGIAISEGLATLRGSPDAPYWDVEVINCDEAEIAARTCLAIDGSTTIALADRTGWNGGIVARDPLPIELRPPTNFEWRSDPHGVNGGGTARLNPGGGFYAAYWMGRMLEAASDGFLNVSPHARERTPPGPEPDAGVATDGGVRSDGGTDGGGDAGCGCVAAGARPASAAGSLAALGIAVLVALRRVRMMRR